MKTVIGILMMVVGVALGAYVGVWVCFVGGIIDIITQLKAPDLEAMAVAVGVLKIMGAGFAGVMSGIILVIPGYVMAAK